MRVAIDGNEAAASVAFRLSEICCIFPITPSSPMAERADEWSSQGRTNVWGTTPGVVEMQSEGGAAGALHRFNLEGKLPIVAFDGDPETLDWIDRGAIAATVTQKPYVMSYYGLKFLDDLHHNAVHQFKDWRTALAPPVPTFVDTGTLIVDKNNIKLYREALSTHPKPM